MIFLFFKQKTAYEVRISDWSSDVCSSDLQCRPPDQLPDRRALCRSQCRRTHCRPRRAGDPDHCHCRADPGERLAGGNRNNRRGLTAEPAREAPYTALHFKVFSPFSAAIARRHLLVLGSLPAFSDPRGTVQTTIWL